MFNPWVGKIPWRRKWWPTPVFLPRKSYGQRSLAGLQSVGSQRVRHDWETAHSYASMQSGVKERIVKNRSPFRKPVGWSENRCKRRTSISGKKDGCLRNTDCKASESWWLAAWNRAIKGGAPAPGWPPDGWSPSTKSGTQDAKLLLPSLFVFHPFFITFGLLWYLSW